MNASGKPGEDETLSLLHGLGLLDRHTLPALDRIARLSAERFGVPIAFVSLLAADEQLLKGRYGLGLATTRRDDAICAITVGGRQVTIIPDTLADPRTANNPHVTGDPHIRFYAGVPIALEDGDYIGACCIADHRPRQLDSADTAALIEFASLAEALLNVKTIENLLRHAEAAHARKAVESEQNRRMLLQTQRLAGMAAWSIDVETRRLIWSPEVFAFHDMHGGEPPRPEDALLFYPAGQREQIRAQFMSALKNGTQINFESDLITARGVTKRVRCIGEYDMSLAGQPRVVGMLQDITEQHRSRRALENAVILDSLTGLLNRAEFQLRLNRSLERAARNGDTCWLMLLDLDKFKDVNDSHGHAAGDQLLRTIAQRLTSILGHRSDIARLGGDEFAISLLASDFPDTSMRALAEQLIAALKEPISIGESHIGAYCTIGMASSDDALNPALLLRCADLALYHGKRRQPGSARIFQRHMERLFEERRTAVQNVEAALDEDRLIAYYQPLVSLSDRKVFGYEALMRLQDPGGRIVTASEISPALTDPVVSRRVSDRMIARVIADMVTLRKAGQGAMALSLNTSEADLIADGFADMLLGRLAAAEISPASIRIEVTETMFLGNDTAMVRQTLETLRRAGVAIALDDFGTGFSSLTHLRDFPIDNIKIDKSFVAQIGFDAESEAIVRSVVRLANDLAITVIAEGVESDDQCRFLRTVGCTAGQGYLFGRPQPIGALVKVDQERAA